MDRIRTLIAQLSEQLEAMSSRDRNLLTGLIAGLAVIFVLGITWSLRGVLEDRASRVIDAKQDLALMLELADDYADLEVRIEAAEARMATFNPTQVNTYLEGWANEAGMLDHLRGVRETGSRSVGDYRERDYAVEVQRAELTDVVKFLHAIETSDFPIEVTSARFKVARTRDDRFLDLDLELATYTKDDEG